MGSLVMAHCHSLPSVANPFGVLQLHEGLCGWGLTPRWVGRKEDLGDFYLLPSVCGEAGVLGAGLTGRVVPLSSEAFFSDFVVVALGITTEGDAALVAGSHCGGSPCRLKGPGFRRLGRKVTYILGITHDLAWEGELFACYC